MSIGLSRVLRPTIVHRIHLAFLSSRTTSTLQAAICPNRWEADIQHRKAIHHAFSTCTNRPQEGGTNISKRKARVANWQEQRARKSKDVPGDSGENGGDRDNSGAAAPNQNVLVTDRQEQHDVKRPESPATAEDNTIRPRQPPLTSLPDTEEQDPRAWMFLLEPFLPPHLRFPPTGDSVNTFQDGNVEDLVKVLTQAREPGNIRVDLLTYMVVTYQRYKAVLYLVNLLVRASAQTTRNTDIDRLPSNLAWPAGATDDYWRLQPTEIQSTVYTSNDTADRWVGAFSSDEQTGTSKVGDAAIHQLWLFLGNLIIRSTSLEPERSRPAMSVVYQALAQLHNQDLIPENIYSYNLAAQSSSTQRPPILHLLSSRILTALSDAVWRSHQDEVISQAAQSGVSYKDLGHDPPGGRFRLTVRDLGPEVWLEFVLWCCVEAGDPIAAAGIIDMLGGQEGEPWFAVHWSPSRTPLNQAPAVDWDRVKLRSGGTVGRIEGYSREKPFVDVPYRTISAEVVLATVDGLINVAHLDADSQVLSMKSLIRLMETVVTFLEPHGLSSAYFDFLAVRLLQSGSIFEEKQADTLHLWARTLMKLRSLEQTDSAPIRRLNLDYDSVLHHSELLAGLLHQSLQAYINASDVQQSVEVFAEIQQLVDSSKLVAIGAFLSAPASKGFFTMRAANDDLEFKDSHGHLPSYKIAAFLNVVTDANLISLGNWLFYTEDVDGPVIAQSSFGDSCMASAIIRFAAQSRDYELVRQVMAARRKSRLKPSVNFLRAMINAQFSFMEFETASRILSEITLAQAGGYSPSNLASLAATILRMESGMHSISHPKLLSHLEEKATTLLGRMLDGQYEGSHGYFTRIQKRLFLQQIGALLRMFASITGSRLKDVAEKYLDAYPSSNNPIVPTSTFNIVLNAVVDCRGASEGQRMWGLFCKDPRTITNFEEVPLLSDYLVARNTGRDDDELERSYAFRSQRERPTMTASHIPIIALQTASLQANQNPDISSPGHSLDHLATSIGAGPRPDSSIAFNTELNFASDDDYDIPFSVKAVEAQAQQTSAPDPIVVPDFRTLRIIVRAALAERRAQQQSDFAQTRSWEEQRSLLKWAKKFYDSFPISRKSITREFQQAIETNDLHPAQSQSVDIASLRQMREREAHKVMIADQFSGKTSHDKAQ